MASAIRRNRDETEARLISAVEQLILESGFGAIGINALARRAGVDKVLIYRYFGGLPGLLAAYGERGEFWWQVEDLFAEPFPDGNDTEELLNALALIFRRHAGFLRSHPVTLEVIAWEMSERNELTEALEAVRESRSIAAMRRIGEQFHAVEPEILEQTAPVFGLLGAATNYLSARARQLRTFNGIDLQSEQGWTLLSQTAEKMIAGVFSPG